MIITIDGPAGVGKSTAAQSLADALGFACLNTGAMYRCVALATLEHRIPLTDHDHIVALAQSLAFEQQGKLIFLNGVDVTERIRERDVATAVGSVADIVALRKVLIQWQRAFAKGRDIVTEGRDQGTEVFDNAECKIFLTASAEVRARRRTDELIAKGLSADYSQILADQIKRDFEDAHRPVGALRQATDSKVVESDHLSREDVVKKLLEIVRTSNPIIGNT